MNGSVAGVEARSNAVPWGSAIFLRARAGGRGPVSNSRPGVFQRLVGVLLLVALSTIPILGSRAPLLLAFGALSSIWIVPRSIADRRLSLLTLALLGSTAVGTYNVFARGLNASIAFADPSFRIMLYVSALLALIAIFKLSARDVLLGGALGVGVLWFHNPSDSSFASLWKYGIGVPIALILLAHFDTMPAAVRRTAMLVMAGLAFVSALLGFRSLALFLLVSIVFCWIQTRIKQRPGSRVLIGTMVSVSVAVVAIAAVPSLAATGLLGGRIEASFAKNEVVSRNPLLGGRAELPISIATVMEAPFLGQGVLPLASTDLVSQATRVSQYVGVNVGAGAIRVWINPATGVVNAHSVIMEMWIVSGIAGMFSGVLILLLVGRALLSEVRSSKPTNVGWVLLCFIIAWDLLFSPLLTGRDILIGMVVVLGILSLESSSENRETMSAPTRVSTGSAKIAFSNRRRSRASGGWA